jgi:hypothetical protein
MLSFAFAGHTVDRPRSTATATVRGATMNEQEWLTSTKTSGLLHHLYYHGKVATRAGGRRKLRLFAPACCRRIWHLIPEGPARQAVLRGERSAEQIQQLRDQGRHRQNLD